MTVTSGVVRWPLGALIVTLILWLGYPYLVPGVSLPGGLAVRASEGKASLATGLEDVTHARVTAARCRADAGVAFFYDVRFLFVIPGRAYVLSVPDPVGPGGGGGIISEGETTDDAEIRAFFADVHEVPCESLSAGS